MALHFPVASLDFAEDLGTEVVDIFVGSDRKRFVVHKKPLISGSDYFNKALNGNFKEATENAIHLEEMVPSAVGLMIGWIYRGALPGMEKNISPFIRSNTSNPETSTVVPNATSINGTCYPYATTLNTTSDITGRELYTHISAQPQYSAFSSEELRLADYSLGRRITPSLISNTIPNTAGTASSVGQRGLLGTPALYNITSNPATSIFNTQSVYQGSSLFGSLPNPYGSYNLSNSTNNSIFNNQAGGGSSLFRTVQSGSEQSQAIQGNTVRSLGLPTQLPNNAISSGQFFNTSDTPNYIFATMTQNLAASNASNPTPQSFSVSSATREQSLELNETSKSGSVSNEVSSQNDKAPIPGIPKTQPIAKALMEQDTLVVNLLSLCIFAETICWLDLYNAALEAYIRTELSLLRPIPVKHVGMIYDQTHCESSLRKFALECIFASGLKTPTYIDVARDYDDLFEEIMSQLSIRRNGDDHQIDDAKIRSYYMKQRCPGKQKDTDDINMVNDGDEGLYDTNL